MSTTANFEGIKVVYIDDSKMIRRTMETLLRKAGCQVVTAHDGFEGLSRVVELQPDIIFVDNMMPRLNGHQTCILIRSNPVFKLVPIIMVSSCDGLFERTRSKIMGATHYMTYPITREELFNAIKIYVVDVKKSKDSKFSGGGTLKTDKLGDVMLLNNTPISKQIRFSEAFRSCLKYGKYVTWAANLTEEQLLVLLWLVGEYGCRACFIKNTWLEELNKSNIHQEQQRAITTLEMLADMVFPLGVLVYKNCQKK
ncbi:MAG: response regulator [Thioploca sp.]|nr:response regulator [Thioploca sp.]